MNNEFDARWKRRGVTVWEPSKVNIDAVIGDGVQVGSFCEVGPRVIIGDGARIGAFSFIPEGVIIKDNAWIGPRCTFTNDRFPPSPRDGWEPTVVEQGARLGAGVTVVCGVTIGEGALVGAGSVVTKNIPSGETWAGTPAQKIKTDSKEE
ncbi:MAG: N-acetyltransferase [Bacteroidales bacterium]|nr:N-acetyltransferase [Bacteroidales bacterium]